MCNENFPLEPQYSKTFGFPDNSAVIDPDNSLIDTSGIGGLLKRDTVRDTNARISSNLAEDRY
jgi:hypothetical protein